MSSIYTHTMPGHALQALLAGLADSLAYLIQSLYSELQFVKLDGATLDLGNCLEGRAFGDAGEVAWWPDGYGSFRVVVAWDGGPPATLQGWGGATTSLPEPQPDHVFLWGSRMDTEMRWFDQRVARAQLRYPVDIPDGNDARRVRMVIVRYPDPETGELLHWRMSGLEPVDSHELIKQAGQDAAQGGHL